MVVLIHSYVFAIMNNGPKNRYDKYRIAIHFDLIHAFRPAYTLYKHCTAHRMKVLNIE